jgi:nitrate reductase alpha subunit
MVEYLTRERRLEAAGLGQSRPRLPKGSIGFRWGKQDPGKWNLQMEEAVSGEALDPELSFIDTHDAVIELEFDDFEAGEVLKRSVPVRYIETESGRVAVATVFDLMLAQFGVGRGLPGVYPQS